MKRKKIQRERDKNTGMPQLALQGYRSWYLFHDHSDHVNWIFSHLNWKKKKNKLAYLSASKLVRQKIGKKSKEKKRKKENCENKISKIASQIPNKL